MPVIIRDNATDSCILRMQWNQCQDTFQFLCKLDTGTHVVSKRVILSEVAKLFDPLGLLGPVIVIAKIILQDLWQLAIQWDEFLRTSTHVGLPSEQMNDLNQLRIPRCVKLNFMPNRGSADFATPANAHLEPAYTFAPSSISTTITPSYCAQSLAPLKIIAIAIRAIGRLTIGALNQQG